MDWKKNYKILGGGFLELVAPRQCIICQKSIAVNRNECHICHVNLFGSQVPKDTSSHLEDKKDRIIWYDEHVSLFYWSDIWKKYLYEWKYGNQRKLYQIFLKPLEKKIQFLNTCNIDRIGVIDSGFFANRDRGYKPCFDIAKHVSLEMNCSVYMDLVKKKRFKQSKMKYEERFWSMHNSLRCKARFDSTNYLLIEDIFTTGATVNEAARMLKLNGVQNVFVLSMVYQKDEEEYIDKIA